MSAPALVRVWREKADALAVYAPAAAHAFREAAADLDAALRADGDELLTLEVAARISGYSVDHLGRLLREGKLRNAGRLGAPRICRGDLPRRPAGVAAGPGGTYDPYADARSLAIRRKEMAP